MIFAKRRFYVANNVRNVTDGIGFHHKPLEIAYAEHVPLRGSIRHNYGFIEINKTPLPFRPKNSDNCESIVLYFDFLSYRIAVAEKVFTHFVSYKNNPVFLAHVERIEKLAASRFEVKIFFYVFGAPNKRSAICPGFV